MLFISPLEDFKNIISKILPFSSFLLEFIINLYTTLSFSLSIILTILLTMIVYSLVNYPIIGILSLILLASGIIFKSNNKKKLNIKKIYFFI